MLTTMMIRQVCKHYKRIKSLKIANSYISLETYSSIFLFCIVLKAEEVEAAMTVFGN